MKPQQQHHTTDPSSLLRVNVEIERAVIGTLLSVPNSLMDLCDGFSKDYFYTDFYAQIFGVIKLLDDERSKVDVLTVSERMKKENINFDVVELMSITNFYTFELFPYSLIVKEKAIERSILNIAMEIGRRIADNEDVGDILFTVGEKTNSLMENLVGTADSSHIGEVVVKSINELNIRIERRNAGLMAGISTGLADMNRHTRGWQNQDLIVLGARPGMGKTASALHFVRAAAEAGTPVCVFSLEMGDRQLVDRMLVGESGVNSEAFNAGIIPEQQIPSINRAAEVLSVLPIHIDDSPSVTISYIRSRCRILKRQNKCGMIVVDYLQLMAGQREHNGNREQEVAMISKGCKAIAKELDVPLILLAQLNRECEKRPDKRPLLSDLRESGSIEQDADIVCFIHRPEQYGLVCEFEGNKLDNGIEFIFAKFRNGSCGTIYAQHNESKTKLFDVNTHQYEENRFNTPPPVSAENIMPF